MIETDPSSGVPMRSIRLRILLWYALILTLAVAAAVFAVYRVLVVQTDREIDADLAQEVDELRRLSRGIDPETGERFRGDVRRIFEVFLDRNIPHSNEMFLTFVNSESFLYSVQEPPYPLYEDGRILDLWDDVSRPTRGRVDTPAGEVEYLALPLVVGGEPRGVFVDAIFRDEELAELTPAITGAAGVGLAALLIGSVLAWRVTEGVLQRVRSVTRAAEAISGSDLTRRITVHGRDEISALAATFNGMLDRLEEAFAVQRQFIDDAGHELRTPITVIRGHLELLEEDPAEREKTLALVNDELERMSRIVDDLLILAKAERPDFLRLDTVELSSLTEEMLAKATALASRDWRLDHAARGRVVVDRQRLTQAMIQLAQNATAHTDEGDQISLGSDISDGQARLWVRDTGPGIPPEEQALIFRRFSRGRGIHRTSDGAGLGLAIVRAIVEAHHGRVEVDSQPGQGATFTVVVPVDPPMSPDEAVR